MMKYKSAAIVLSVLIAVIIPVMTAMKAHRALLSAPIVKVEIEPYDPRDLMYGHYLTFKIKWNWKAGEPNTETCIGEECCLCVEEGEENPAVSLAMCPAPTETLPGCAHTIRGQYHGGDTFETDINRYYVDEDFALPLEKLFRDKGEKFFIGLVMAGAVPIQEELYVGGMSLPDYIQKNKAALLNSETPAP